MWQVQLNPPQTISTPTQKSENTLIAERTKPELAQWYHAKLFIPIKHTIIQAIKKGYFSTWTNLTSKLINKHLPPSMATAKVHMQKNKKEPQVHQYARVKDNGTTTDETTGTTHQHSVHSGK